VTAEASRGSILSILIILWLCGAALRLPLLAVPPVLTAIQTDLNLSGTEVGLLSSLPVVLFALFAIPGALVIARTGVVWTLAAGLLIAALGAVLRGAATGSLILYGTTIVMAAGIAMMQVAMPAAVRLWMPARPSFATALYTNGLLVGEVLPVALTAPLVLPLVDGSWRGALALWAVPMVVIAALLVPLAPRIKLPAAGPPRWRPDWENPLVWRLGLIFASVTATYFAANGFIPAHLTAAGRPDLVAPALTALNIIQLPASFVLLAVATRLERRAWPLVAFGISALVATAGVALSGSAWTIVWAGLVGFSTAGALTLVFALPALLGAAPDIARLSAGMFTIGYVLAVIIAVLGGVAWDLTGKPAFAFLPIAIGVLPLILLSAGLPLTREKAG
jgi:CP family cyanate transporter-like MFS transporter